MAVASCFLTVLLLAHGTRGDIDAPRDEIDPKGMREGVPVNADKLFDALQGLTSQVGALAIQVAELQAAVAEARDDREQSRDLVADAASCTQRHPLGWNPREHPSGISVGDAIGSGVTVSDALLPPSLASKRGASWQRRFRARHLLSGSVAGAAMSDFDTSPRLNLTDGIKKICIYPWQPIVKCSPAEDQSTYEGYMVNAFRGVAEELGWSPDSWYFECIEDLPDLWDEMLGEDGTCYMAAHGAQIIQSWLDLGVKFSIPTHRAGYSVLVKGSASDPDMFAMFQVFGWDIWLMLGITSILVSVVILLMDAAPQYIGSAKKSPNAVQPSDAPASAQEGEEGKDDAAPWYEALAGMTYDNIGLLVATGGPEGTSCPAKFVILAYGLLVVLILALFTANTAAYVTTKALSSSIQGVSDLPNRKVASLEPMVDNLVNKYGIKKADMTVLPTNSWVEDFWGLLENGDVEALIIPDHAAEFTASVKCETFIAGGLFEQVFLGFAFPPVTPDSDIYAFSNGLIQLDERDNVLEELQAAFIENQGESLCGEAQYSETDTVMFDQVAGLWVILALATYMSTMYIMLRWVYYGFMECCRKRSRRHDKAPASVNTKGMAGGSASAKAPDAPLLPSVGYTAAQSLPVAQPASAPYGAQQPAVDADLSMPPPAEWFPDSETQAAEEGVPRTEFVPQDAAGTSQMRPNPPLRPTSAMPQRAGKLPPL